MRRNIYWLLFILLLLHGAQPAVAAGATATPTPSEETTKEEIPPPLQLSMENEEIEPLTELDTRLFEAISIGRTEDVKILLERGANPNSYNAEKRRALSIAVDRTDDQSAPMAKLLLDAGANPNVSSGFNDLPLIIAIKKENAEIVWSLIAHGANYYVSDERGLTPLVMAEKSKNVAIIDLIKQAMARDEAIKAALRSNAALKEKTRQLAYYQCINSYMGYYVGSGIETDPVRLDALKKRLEMQKGIIGTLQTEIQKTFTLKKLDAVVGRVMDTTSTTVIQELEGMVSNRYRKKMGVGTNDDMKTRCSRISSHWELDR